MFDSLYVGDLVEDDGQLSLEVGATAEQASWTDTGTDPHPIDSTGPWSLHDGQGNYFGRHVNHPGYEGSLWFDNATNEDRWAEQLQFAFDLS